MDSPMAQLWMRFTNKIPMITYSFLTFVEDDVVCDMWSGGWREGLWGGGRCGMWHAKWRMTWGPVRCRTMWYVTCEVEDDLRAFEVEDDVICDMPIGGWREGMWGGGRCGMWHAKWRMAWGPVRCMTMWYVTCEVEDDVRACEVQDDVVCDMRSGGWREGLWGGGRCGMWHAKWRMTWGPVRCMTMWYVTCEVENDVRACEVEDDVVCDMRSGGWREGLWGAWRCGMWHAKWRMTWGRVRCRTMWYVTCEAEDDVRAYEVEDHVMSILYWPSRWWNTLAFILYALCKWKSKIHWKCFCVSKLSKYLSGTKVTEPRKFW